MRTLGIMAAIAASLYGIIWALADYGFSQTCSSDPGLGSGYCPPPPPNLHTLIAPAALTAAAIAAIILLAVAPKCTAKTET